MLTDLGLQWVILGHSERRDLFHESDEVLIFDRLFTNIFVVDR